MLSAMKLSRIYDSSTKHPFAFSQLIMLKYNIFNFNLILSYFLTTNSCTIVESWPFKFIIMTTYNDNSSIIFLIEFKLKATDEEIFATISEKSADCAELVKN